jgi:hypothetical protein
MITIQGQGCQKWHSKSTHVMPERAKPRLQRQHKGMCCASYMLQQSGQGYQEVASWYFSMLHLNIGSDSESETAGPTGCVYLACTLPAVWCMLKAICDARRHATAAWRCTAQAHAEQASQSAVRQNNQCLAYLCIGELS